VCKFDIQKFGFVAPYSSQVRQLKIEMQGFGIADNVMTVDSWQGREKPFMIMSTVRSNDDRQIGFLNSYRRLNVALTRAQHGLIIVGNRYTLSSDNNWSALINHFEQSQRYCENLAEAIEMIEQQRK
jgi:regulator of nonsense transcripts 1